MSSDISGTPLLFMLNYRDVDSTTGPQDHPVVGILQALIVAKLPQAVVPIVMQVLQTPLDTLINNVWSSQEVQTTANAQIQAAILTAESNAYGINVTLPQSGTLSAVVENTGNIPSLTAPWPAGTSGMQLTLDLLIPGIGVSFSTTTGGPFGSSVDPSWSVTFDGTVQIAIGIPQSPLVQLTAFVAFFTSNGKAGPGNVFADLSGLLNAIGNFFSGQPQASGQVPDQFIPIVNGAITTLTDQLSGAFAAAANFGFFTLGVDIEAPPPPADVPSGNTVVFRLGHAPDPAPLVVDALAAPSPNLFNPIIGASAPAVHAGGHLGVTGTNFTLSSMNQLSITWTDTTSGVVTESEIQWGPWPANHMQPSTAQLPPVPKMRNGAYDNGNNFTTPANLAPNASYFFSVRDRDFPLTCTDLSPPLVIQTAVTDQVRLLLNYKNMSAMVGSATLAGGGFSTSITIPATVPPGRHLLRAVTGNQQASTSIDVLPRGHALKPVIQVLDPNTNIAYTGTSPVVATYTTLVRGTNFLQGTVELFVDDASGPYLGSLPVNHQGTFQGPTAPWPVGVTGNHSIFAQEVVNQQTLTTSVAVGAEALPQ